jgi:hypothetical protein
MLVCLFSQEVYVLVAWREALLNVFGLLLTAKDGYYAKGCLYFEAKV